MNKLKIAVEGCCHGELNKIYQSIPKSTDLLLICGDFQALRNQADFQALNVPKKYQKLGDFQDYYKGTKTAPVLTIFIGGNHESSSYLQELKYGGWVAPNIYYLGEFGSVWYKGLLISGWSGIYNKYTFYNNNGIEMEKLPFDSSSIRSVYHQKLTNFIKMYLLGSKSDVILSHDWPVGIDKFGDKRTLLKRKPFFKDDIEKGELGSPLNEILIHHLKPRYWFSGHLHVKFSANINHNEKQHKKHQQLNNHEINLDLDFDEPEPKNETEVMTKRPKLDKNYETSFLALDKVGNKRKFIELIEIETRLQHPSSKNSNLYYDRRSIAINKIVETKLKKLKLDPQSVLKSLASLNQFLPIIEEEISKLDKLNDDEFIVPENFEIIAPVEFDGKLKYFPNNQTKDYCEKFNIPRLNLESSDAPNDDVS
ncbi:DBR1 [Candida pseudojiufengensis]|uniref:DBR1 n=1 Tax=Candida pseudojiufengensis TaxID=497109 RepID=UPI002224698C|nr:DBR1 [Candida pseudojiufengensis]KAI5963114.1 DBR1 [Candida pseudojiufengensis]